MGYHCKAANVRRNGESGDRAREHRGRTKQMAKTDDMPVGINADYLAISERAEQVIDLLRTLHICPGWHENGGLDEAGAERMLRYLARFAAGDGDPDKDDDPDWEAMVKFCSAHGIELGWILRGDPSGMIIQGVAHSRQAVRASWRGPFRKPRRGEPGYAGP
jgi:hypothetical protein